MFKAGVALSAIGGGLLILMGAQGPTTFLGRPLIAAARRIDWTKVGAGTIPTRSTACANLTSAANGNAINAKIAQCGSASATDNVINLAAGTYTISDEAILFNGATQGHVTLRGAGPNQTFLNISAVTGCGLTTKICLAGGTGIDAGSPDNASTLLGGLTQGSTAITIGTMATGSHRPVAGDLLILNQVVDATTRAGDPTPEVFVCLAITQCTQASVGPQDQGNCGAGPCWAQFQVVKVATITGPTPCTDAGPCTVTIPATPLHLPNWGLRTTRAWWSNSPSISGVGIENLSIQGAVGNGGDVGFRFAWGNWIKNVRILDTGGGAPHYIFIGHSALNTVRDSYIFGHGAGDEYAVDCTACSDNLFENNILQYVRTMFEHQMGNGNVFGYNFGVHSANNGGSEQGLISNHGIGAAYWLAEGNDGFGIKAEDYFGASIFLTAFRNRFWGHTSLDMLGGTGGLCVINLQVLSRHANILGNVLGTTFSGGEGHQHYQKIASDGQNSTYGNSSIYGLGNGDDCISGGGSFPADDSLVNTSSYRWANCDAVNGFLTCQYNNGEVPTGLVKYPQTVPATHNLPASLYLASKPSFFGTHTFPPIGPDVTGGDVANSGAHVYRIPARIMFEDTMGGTFADTAVKAFVGW